MIEKGTKVEVRGKKGVFTVGRQVYESKNPLKCLFNVFPEKGESFWIEVEHLMPTVGTHFDIDWQEWYAIECPNCQHEMRCVPTLAQKNGYLLDNRGWCSKCDAVFYSYFNPFVNRMIPQVAV